MNFLIMGFEKGNDELVYEHEVNLPVQDLMLVMSWADSTDCIGADFLMSPAQAEEISNLALVRFPTGLNLYLSSCE
ncbi:hypothetical protein NTD86_06375 [Pseudomonas sp. 7P_10.2_Bac1]|uniref:hypothetical protein n=1 Tax=Pseudomonas sp. 7P_10.2_Bac1 TaxID=2971614 RepID=UPI0021C77337|nr:hypothetical protein [Pseudomonas sp. 7P_10.2_Bac1]MCU1726609.1 hypothetical protein [Pseudomonas sp. 7P_10.2_Bac1]